MSKTGLVYSCRKINFVISFANNFLFPRSHLSDYQSPTPDLRSPTSSNCLAPSPSAFSCNTELSYANDLLSCAIGFDSPPDSPTISPEKLGEFFNASRSTSCGLLEDFQDLTLNGMYFDVVNFNFNFFLSAIPNQFHLEYIIIIIFTSCLLLFIS